MKRDKLPFKVRKYDLVMLGSDISLSCDEFVYATLANGNAEGIQLTDALQDKEDDIKVQCRIILKALQEIDKLIEE